MQSAIRNEILSIESLDSILIANAENEHEKQVIIPVGRKNKDGYIYEDFAELPNLLISGTTGSGKTSFIQTLVTEMMKKYSPSEVRFVFYDSKYVEYNSFDNLSYLLTPVMHDRTKVATAINWTIAEALRRIPIISKTDEKIPHIFIILDDYADLSSDSNITSSLISLFQTSRRTYIHTWIVTSTPTSNVVSTELKANISNRVAFHTTSKSISRSIIDENGAETLAVPGEVILKINSGFNRCDSVFLESNEIQEICKDLEKKYPKASPQEDIILQSNVLFNNIINGNADGLSETINADGWDSYFEDAGRFVTEKQKATIGVIQRIFRIGFNRAARIMDQLAEAGVVSGEDGTKPRLVLMTTEEFERFLAEVHEKDSPDNGRIRNTEIISDDEKQDISINKDNRNTTPAIPLTPQAFIQGRDYIVGVRNNMVEIKTDGHQETKTVKLYGEDIIEIHYKNPRFIGKGRIVIVSKQQGAIYVEFEKIEKDAFKKMMKQLSMDLGKAMIIDH